MSDYYGHRRSGRRAPIVPVETQVRHLANQLEEGQTPVAPWNSAELTARRAAVAALRSRDESVNARIKAVQGAKSFDEEVRLANQADNEIKGLPDTQKAGAYAKLRRARQKATDERTKKRGSQGRGKQQGGAGGSASAAASGSKQPPSLADLVGKVSDLAGKGLGQDKKQPTSREGSRSPSKQGK